MTFYIGNYEVVLRPFPFDTDSKKTQSGSTKMTESSSKKKTESSTAMFSEEDGTMYVTAKQFYLSELMSSTRPSSGGGGGVEEEGEDNSKGVVRIRIQVGDEPTSQGT